MGRVGGRLDRAGASKRALHTIHDTPYTIHNEGSLCAASLLWDAGSRRRGILSWLATEMMENPIGRPAAKRFCPSNPEVPVLEDYRVGPGREWFEKYFVTDNDDTAYPFPVRTEILEERAENVGMANMHEVRRICWEWKFGVEIGVEDKNYEFTQNENNESVYGDFGPQVMDALVSWNKKNIIVGPRWAAPEGVTIIKLTCREKGPGKCRYSWGVIGRPEGGGAQRPDGGAVTRPG